MKNQIHNLAMNATIYRLAIFAILLFSACLIPSSAGAQSIVIRIISNDGIANSTNVINIPPAYVAGAIKAWHEDSERRTNASPPSVSLALSAFIAQEISSNNGREWNSRGGEYSARTFATSQGFAGLSIPPRLGKRWHLLTPQQRTNAIQYLVQEEQQ